MSQYILIRDSELGKPGVEEFKLQMPSEEATVHELIRSRVYQEVKDANLESKLIAQHRGLVPVSEVEQSLNGPKKPEPTSIDWKDWKEQFEKALQGFKTKQFVVLVNEKQIDSLEQSVPLKANTVVSFVKLTPLMGG